MRHAFTTVELVVVVLLFSVVAIGTTDFYRRTMKAEVAIGGRMAAVHACQFAAVDLSRRLRQAREILAPPEGLTETRPYLIFADDLHQLITVYLNEKQQLIAWNRNTGVRDVLATSVIRFRVHRMADTFVTLHLRASDPKSGETFSLLTGASARNTIQ